METDIFSASFGGCIGESFHNGVWLLGRTQPATIEDPYF